MDNVKIPIPATKKISQGEKQTERAIRKADSIQGFQYITLCFPYGIQVKTPLIPHMTCENLLRKVYFVTRLMIYLTPKKRHSESLITGK